MFLFGKKKYSDEHKRLFQRWHDFTINSRYDLNHVYHNYMGNYMLAGVVIPEFKDDDNLQQLADRLKQDIEAHGLCLQPLSTTHLHYVIAVRVAKS